MSIYDLLGYGRSPEASKASAIEQMRTLGAAKMEARYSGGNDEGGVDEILLFDAKGKELPKVDSTIERDPRPGDDEWRIRDGKVYEDHPLWEAADSMLAAEFGTWAGEFHAYGTLHVDAVENKAWRKGSVETPSEDSDYAEW